MVDIKFIRENPSVVQKAAKSKNIDIDVDHILKIDSKRHELQLAVQKLQEERNLLTKSIKGKPSEDKITKGKMLREKVEKQGAVLRAVELELYEWLLKVPNTPKPDVKVGKNESENEIIKTVGIPRKFDFHPKDHLELGELLDIIDIESAGKVSGARFGYLKNEGALLEYALLNLAIEILVKEGFIPVIPPVLIKTEVMRGLGYMENGGDEDMYIIPKDDLILIGTAEHALVAMHKDTVIDAAKLPLRYVGFSSAFRREAGSYGKDTRGIFRVHQFDKVEMVSFVKEGDDDREHEFLLSLEEKFFQLLDIPYQVVKMCTGDLGFPAARKYDIEAWIPSQGKYREVTSVSTVTDFQSKRLNITYKEKSPVGLEKKYTHILNGTACSMNRPIIAILENYQQKDGTVIVPEVLEKYLGKSIIRKK